MENVKKTSVRCGASDLYLLTFLLNVYMIYHKVARPYTEKSWCALLPVVVSLQNIL